jgi:DNA-binding NarL/FixJ family response regulator
MQKKIIVFEDDYRLLSAITEILNLSNFQIIAGYDSYEEYKKNQTSSLAYDIALVDVHLNGISGTDIITKLKSKNPFLKVIMLSNESKLNTVYDAFINGADGYLLKIDAITNLGVYLTQLDMCEYVVSNSVTNVLVQIIKNVPARQFTNRQSVKLTKAQHRVLPELLQGLTYAKISEKLNISPHTVSLHVQKIYRAYKVKSRNELFSSL